MDKIIRVWMPKIIKNWLILNTCQKMNTIQCWNHRIITKRRCLNLSSPTKLMASCLNIVKHKLSLHKIILFSLKWKPKTVISHKVFSCQNNLWMLRVTIMLAIFKHPKTLTQIMTIPFKFLNGPHRLKIDFSL